MIYHENISQGMYQNASSPPDKQIDLRNIYLDI